MGHTGDGHFQPDQFGDQFRASLSALPALNLGWREAATVTGSPVRGLRACFAALVATVNVPKPVSRTSSPRFSASVIAASRLSTAFSASPLRKPVLLTTVATNSLLFIGVPRQKSLGPIWGLRSRADMSCQDHVSMLPRDCGFFDVSSGLEQV